MIKEDYNETEPMPGLHGNGEFTEAELAQLKSQIAEKQDREQRTKIVIEAWNRFQALCKEQRCTFSPVFIATERGNTFQFQINAEY